METQEVARILPIPGNDVTFQQFVGVRFRKDFPAILRVCITFVARVSAIPGNDVVPQNLRTLFRDLFL
jgi:hypothetical protein